MPTDAGRNQSIVVSSRERERERTKKRSLFSSVRLGLMARGRHAALCRGKSALAATVYVHRRSIGRPLSFPPSSLPLSRRAINPFFLFFFVRTCGKKGWSREDSFPFAGARVALTPVPRKNYFPSLLGCPPVLGSNLISPAPTQLLTNPNMSAPALATYTNEAENEGDRGRNLLFISMLHDVISYEGGAKICETIKHRSQTVSLPSPEKSTAE